MRSRSICQLERRSLEAFASRLGIDADVYDRVALEGLKNAAFRHLSSFEERETDHPADLKVIPRMKRILTSESLLEAGSIVTASRREDCDAALTRWADELPLDLKYLEELCRDLGLGASLERKELVESILEKIPSVNLFGFMNAFYSPLFEPLATPVICVYPQLEVTIEACADLIAYCIVSAREEVGDGPADVSLAISRLAERPDIAAASREVVRLAQCESIVREIVHSCSAIHGGEPHYMHLQASIFMTGAQNFIWMHEFGHLLLGHAKQSAGHKVEIQADTFAALTQYKFASEMGNTLPILSGTVALLAIHLCDPDAESTSSHPSTTHRIQLYESHFEEPVRTEIKQFLEFGRAIFREAVTERGYRWE